MKANGPHPSAVSNLLFLVNQRVEGSDGFQVAPSEFLGPTSFSAVFKENQANIGEDLLNEPPDDEIPLNVSSENDQWWKEERLSLGTGILRHFPSQQACWRLLNRNLIVCDIELHMPTIEYCLQSLWSTYGEFLNEPRDTESLCTMAKSILSNACVPLPLTRSTGQWLESFTGNNLRWEIIGTFFAIFGLVTMALPDMSISSIVKDDETIDKRRKFVRKMSECAEACLILCDDNGSVNEFVIWLMHHIHTLHSFYSGDASESLLLVMAD